MIKHLTPRSKKELFLKGLPHKIIWAILTSPYAIFTAFLSLAGYALVFAIMPIIGIFMWARERALNIDGSNEGVNWDDFWAIIFIVPGYFFMHYLKSVWRIKTYLS